MHPLQHLTPGVVADVVASMGPDLTGDLVRELGPAFTADLVDACGADVIAHIVHAFGPELTGKQCPIRRHMYAVMCNCTSSGFLMWMPVLC